MIPTPAPPHDAVTAPGLTHLLRGLHFLALGQPAAAVAHLRLALMHDRDSAFIHGRLAAAWQDAGHPDRADAALQAGLLIHPQDPGLNLQAAEEALAAWSYGDAVTRLAPLAEQPAHLAEAAPLLLQALLWEGRRDEAVVLADRTLAAHPGDGWLAFTLGNHLEDHGLLAASEAAYRQSVAAQPDQQGAAFALARVLDLRGRPLDAADALIGLFRYYPDAALLYIEIARLLRRAESADADAYRREALRQHPDDPDVLLAAAAGDLAEGAVESGIVSLRELLQRHPNHGRARLFLAQQLRQRGDASGCLTTLGDRREIAPELLRERAACLASLGRAGEVVETLRHAGEIGAIPAQNLLTELIEVLRYRVGAGELRAAFAALADDVGAPLEAGQTLLLEVRLADACDEAALARRLAGALPDDLLTDNATRLLVGDIYARHGDTERAVEIFEELVMASPFDATLLNALGFTLADANLRLPAAEVWLRRAYRLAGDSSYIIDSLGWLLHRRGEQRAALRLLLRAATRSPGDPEVLRHLGDVHAALGETTHAQRAYQAALAAHPNAALRLLLSQRLAGQAAGAPEAS